MKALLCLLLTTTVSLANTATSTYNPKCLRHSDPFGDPKHESDIEISDEMMLKDLAT